MSGLQREPTLSSPPDKNLFRYILDVKPYLRSGENRLEIKFQSPVEYARIKYEEQSQVGHSIFINIIPH